MDNGPGLPETGISLDRLQHIGKVFSSEPQDFNVHNSKGVWSVVRVGVVNGHLLVNVPHVPIFLSSLS